MLVLSLSYLGATLIGAGDFAAARQVLNEALQRLQVAQYPFFTVIAFYYFAELLVMESYDADLCATAIARGQNCTVEEIVGMLLSDKFVAP